MMRKTLLLIAFTVVSIWVLCGHAAIAGTLRVVHWVHFPSEFELPMAKGLAWDGQHLWTTMHSGTPWALEKAIVELDPSAGSILSSSWFDMRNIMLGFTWDGTHLRITSLHAGTDHAGQPLADYVVKRTRDGGFVSAIPAPHSPHADPMGVTWDGAYLWVADFDHREIAQIDPNDGSVMTAFPSPALEPHGLTWDGSSLWSVDRADGTIYQMDTAGNVVETWSSPATDPWGLTFDGQYLWLLDNGSRKILQLTVPEPSSITLLAFAVLGLAALARRRQWQRA